MTLGERAAYTVGGCAVIAGEGAGGSVDGRSLSTHTDNPAHPPPDPPDVTADQPVHDHDGPTVHTPLEQGTSPAETVHAIAYIRVSTDEQGIGLDAQRDAIEAWARIRGWALEIAVDHGFSGGTLERPALEEALRRLDRGEISTLVVAKLDRLSRSVADFLGLAERAVKRGWQLVALDIGVDMTTPGGRFIATVVAAMAEWERSMISERTSAALQAKRARGTRLGGPVLIAQEIRERIAAEHAAGDSLRRIADRLTAEEIPTARGGTRWHASTVRSVLASLEVDADVRRTRAHTTTRSAPPST